MTQIIRDPLVADNLYELDIRAEGACDEARRLYELGGLILLRGHRFDVDYRFLNSLDFDVDGSPEIRAKIKKYSGEKILALRPDARDDVERFVFSRIFSGDAGRLSYFQEQVQSGNEQAATIYRRIFPNYKDYKRVFTWRFTETLFENMHWDNFHIPQEFHQVRVFCNIDRNPRIWRTTHTIDFFAREIYERQGLARFAHKSGDDLVIFINNKVLGGMNAPCLDRLPKHHIAFEQGDIWLCETRLVSHQIYQGQKAVATMFFVEPSSMDNPELCFDERIRRLHSEMASMVAPPEVA